MFKTMKCTRVEKFLPLYIAGDLKGGRRRQRAVEKHLATCEPCRRAALEYEESREMFRAAALSPDFDSAFYDELRSSVLARIRRDRWRLAPPSAFPGRFGARFAYAASLVLLALAAALALHAYVRRTPEGGARQNVIAGAKRVQPPAPALSESSAATRQRSGDVQAPRPLGESARVTTGKARRAAKSSFPQPGAHSERTQNGSLARLPTTSRAPATNARKPLVPATAATLREGVAKMAATADGSGGTTAQPGVSRIEIQTSDPNIRIIWLSPGTEDPAGTLK